MKRGKRMKERKKRKYRRYSQEFKEKIVSEYAEGQLTCRELGGEIWAYKRRNS